MSSRRRQRRTRLLAAGLTNSQRWELLYGEPLPAGEVGFSSESAARIAWTKHREQLLAEFKAPGRRPHAFFRFELKASPRRWFDELALLIEKGLIDDAEAAAVRRAHPAMAAELDRLMAKQIEKEK